MLHGIATSYPWHLRCQDAAHANPCQLILPTVWRISNGPSQLVPRHQHRSGQQPPAVEPILFPVQPHLGRTDGHRALGDADDRRVFVRADLGGDDREPAPAVYRTEKDGSKVKAADHTLYRLLHDEPTPEMTSFVFRETLMKHLLLWGNAYAQVIRNGLNEIIGLCPLIPNRMSVGRDDAGRRT
ncbi:phage portal protein [Corynebacterium pseudodiphtheriticum]|uniref:phage portal protein n=1 Tax=Corynebacterium pseudodiphtheriticum TaxID=37637 RepID=UPI0025503D7F|nr:phage portal protein [Corynebacterium pseudodiphtheriticum]MDK8613305.1 phage portal protein [Corynebacterium pseudodiphtheriticum]MDK8737238.1 phage portal protein [Corynebacterium pseudodiphtheriticum]MDK8744619.1 phage portal protein [Corynebacterium pseudodiphtheriticum]MDK8760814.1 phage portal protein [Corynebacterium pseudodiphtheriticum]